MGEGGAVAGGGFVQDPSLNERQPIGRAQARGDAAFYRAQSDRRLMYARPYK